MIPAVYDQILQGNMVVQYGQMSIVGAGLILGTIAATTYRRRTRRKRYTNGNQ